MIYSVASVLSLCASPSASALVAVGSGKLKTEQVAALLDGEKRVHLIETAPAKGLFLWRVEYGGRARGKKPSSAKPMQG